MEGSRTRCPYCAEDIRPEAVRCPHCRSRLAAFEPERWRRVLSMVDQMEDEGFGYCTLHGECQEACPKEITIDNIVRMNRDYLRATIAKPAERPLAGGE